MSTRPKVAGRAADTTPPPASTLRTLLPFLLSLAAIAGLAELGYAVVNISTLPVYVKYGLGLPNLVGFAITAFLLSEAVLNGPMGVLADRLGRRRLMVLGPLISVFTCAITALLRVPDEGVWRYLAIAGLFGLRILDGAGAAALWPAVFAAIGDRADEKQQSSAMSILNVTYMLGLAFGPLVGGRLNDFYAHLLHLPREDPWRYAPALFTASACFLACSTIGWFVAPRRAKATTRLGTGGSTASSDHAALTLASIGVALRRMPQMILLVFLIFFGIGLIAPNAKLFAMEQFGVSETAFGEMLLIPALVVAAISVPAGLLADRIGKPRAIHLGIAICAVALWLILGLETEWAIVLLGTLLGVGFVVAFPAYMALVSDIAGTASRASMIGAVRTGQGFGMLIGAAIASPLYEHNRLLPFIGAAVLLTIGLLLSLLTVRERATPILEEV